MLKQFLRAVMFLLKTFLLWSPIVFQWLSHSISFLLKSPPPTPHKDWISLPGPFLPLWPRGNPQIPRRGRNAKPLAFPSQHPHQGMVFLPQGILSLRTRTLHKSPGGRWPYWWLEHYRAHWSHSAWFNVVLAFLFQNSSVGLPIHPGERLLFHKSKWKGFRSENKR